MADTSAQFIEGTTYQLNVLMDVINEQLRNISPTERVVLKAALANALLTDDAGLNTESVTVGIKLQRCNLPSRRVANVWIPQGTFRTKDANEAQPVAANVSTKQESGPKEVVEDKVGGTPMLSLTERHRMANFLLQQNTPKPSCTDRFQVSCQKGWETICEVVFSLCFCVFLIWVGGKYFA